MRKPCRSVKLWDEGEAPLAQQTTMRDDTTTKPWLNVSAQLTIRVYLTEVARPHSQGGFCD